MNFFDSNSDLNVFLGRILILVNQLSLTKDGKHLLDIERIVIYDFFLKYPLILSKVLSNLNKKLAIDIKENEINNVTTFYPTYSELYKFNQVKVVLQLLYAQGLLNISKQSDGTLLISTSSAGEVLAGSLDSTYFIRIREISTAVASLHKISFSSLRDSVNSLLYE